MNRHIFGILALCVALAAANPGTVLDDPLRGLNAYHTIIDRAAETAPRFGAEIRADAPASFDDLDKFVTQTMDCTHVPGVAMGVLHKGQVVYKKEFGVRDVAKNLPVTADTLFGIGSTTKAMTGVLASMFRDEKKLDFDVPARTFLKDLAFDDEFTSARTTLRDMMTHRTGLPRHDMCVLFGGFKNRTDLINRMRFLQSNAELRTKWQYNNAMWALVGEAAARASDTGKEWADLVAERIFAPLEMTSTMPTFHAAQAATENLARPVMGFDAKAGKYVPMKWEDNLLIDVMGPAGSVNSNAADMLKWIAFNVAGDSQDLVSAPALADAHQPHMVIDGVNNTDTMVFAGYGLGWMTLAYRGELIRYHNGGTYGHITQVLLHEKSRSGVVVLTNSEGASGMSAAAAFRAMDTILGLPPLVTADQVCSAPQPPAPAPGPDGPPATDPSFEGEYHNPGYGRLLVKGGEVTLNENLSGPMTWAFPNKDVVYVSVTLKHTDGNVALSLPGAIQFIRSAQNAPVAAVLVYTADVQYKVPFVRAGLEGDASLRSAIDGVVAGLDQAPASTPQGHLRHVL